jgi:hypothetical protein
MVKSPSQPKQNLLINCTIKHKKCALTLIIEKVITVDDRMIENFQAVMMPSKE